MKYPRLLAAIRSAKWAVMPATLQAIRDALSERAAAGIPSRIKPRGDDGWIGDENDSPEETPPYDIVGPGIAAVNMHGIIGRNLSGFEMSCGGCDLCRVEENLTRALAAPEVLAVILDIDSPGGTVTGVAEFAEKIAKLSSESGKLVFAYTAGQMCSAAYWIACGCFGIACAPSADVGSIGVYMALIDESANWQEEGYKLVLIKAGKYKAAGISGSQISDDQIALWKSEVDEIYSAFTGAVRAARGTVADETMQGQTFMGKKALAANLADLIAPDLEAMAELLAPTANTIAAHISN